MPAMIGAACLKAAWNWSRWPGLTSSVATSRIIRLSFSPAEKRQICGAFALTATLCPMAFRRYHRSRKSRRKWMSNVRAVAGRNSSASRYSEAEWQTRLDVAASYRLVLHFGLSELIYNHITARIPGSDHEYLINP